MSVQSDDRVELEIGSSFAGYRIEELAGRQRGRGRVYVATHLESERRLEFPPWPVALKVFGRAADDFEQFAGRQQAVHHPSVVSIYEVGAQPMPFISMTLFRGATLADLIASGELSDERSLSVLTAVAAGLDAAAQQGVVYRRLRPGGILVAGDGGRAFLGDFGAGRSATSTDLGEGEELGTFVDYISPEEVRGDEVSVVGNVFSLAAIAFECLAGKLPFPHEAGGHALQTRLEQPARPLLGLRPDLSPRFERVFRRALSGDPGKRPRSAGELVEELERAHRRRARSPSRPGAMSASATRAVAASPPLSAEQPARRREGQGTRDQASRRERRARRPGPAAATATAQSPTRDSAEVIPARADSRGAQRRSRPLALSTLALVIAVMAGAAALGLALSPGPDASVGAPVVAKSAAAQVRHPGDWRRASSVPPIPGLDLLAPIALMPRGQGSAGGVSALVVGDMRSAEVGSLPPGLLGKLAQPPRRRTVEIGSQQAYRYAGLRPAGLRGELTLYVIPTSRAALALVCLAPAGGRAFLADCERVVSTVTLRGRQAVPVAASPTYARRLGRVILRLNTGRASWRKRLLAARTHSGQAGAASRLAAAYAAADKAAARIPAPPGARGVHARIVRELDRNASAYERMSSAARARSSRGWNAARGGVAAHESLLQGLLVSLDKLGYDVGA